MRRNYYKFTGQYYNNNSRDTLFLLYKTRKLAIGKLKIYVSTNIVYKYFVIINIDCIIVF